MKTISTLVVISLLIFFVAGDSFLPKPLSTISFNTRNSVNKMLLGLMPNPKIEKPSKQHDNEVNRMEQRVKGERGSLLDNN
ncbi:hypothetical protein [Aphanothece sacrum]|uniref:Uncharacterized protein n=1 Tax=Aphanothece sacrum FPU1 TaxID=1920663 RepID=A0A401IHV6_APHSA|nr:hypothetical protein [Aphanothece sacrum]GBF80895.1 hypothetical protein AsFPU1_2304 [Aphanothece sacrum FPU1]